MEINGIAHAILTVRDMAVSRPFYQALLAHLGLSEIVNTPLQHPQCSFFIAARGAQLLDNAPEDIRDAALEMLDRVQGNLPVPDAQMERWVRMHPIGRR